MRKTIIIRTQFVGFHRYKEAPFDVSFLRNYHRHLFKVEAKSIIEKDREIEFFQLKKKIDGFIEDKFENRAFDFSCEKIAEIILEYLPELNSVAVFEDGENGSEVSR